MNQLFKEIINTDEPKLKSPHFIIDHEVKEVEKPFPFVASYVVYQGKSQSGKSRRVYGHAFHNVIKYCDPKTQL